MRTRMAWIGMSRIGMASSGWRRIFAAGLTAGMLSGCSQSDLKDYRPVDKAAHSGSSSSSATGHAIAPDGVVTTGTDPADRTAAKTNTGSSFNTDAEFMELPVSALAPLNVVDGASVAMLLKVAPGEKSAFGSKVAPGEAAPASTDNTVQPVSAASAAAAKPRTAELLIPEKTFQRDASSKALRVSFDDLDLLKVLNLEPVTEKGVGLMPDWLKGLNGQRIRLRGFMFPTFEAEGIERFVLARDNQICCFGRDPKVYDLVQVDLRSGKTTNYIPATRAFDVIGRFKIDMVSDDGKPYGLYYIEDAEIIDR